MKAVPMRTLVTPSPRDLVDRLDTGERVAIDHILEKHLDTSWDNKRPFGEDLPNVDDPTLVALVPDKKRRTFLLGLTTQLRALGDTLDDLITARERKDPP
jgi:hypothetical protein